MTATEVDTRSLATTVDDLSDAADDGGRGRSQGKSITEVRQRVNSMGDHPNMALSM